MTVKDSREHSSCGTVSLCQTGVVSLVQIGSAGSARVCVCASLSAIQSIRTFTGRRCRQVQENLIWRENLPFEISVPTEAAFLRTVANVRAAGYKE